MDTFLCLWQELPENPTFMGLSLQNVTLITLFVTYGVIWALLYLTKTGLLWLHGKLMKKQNILLLKDRVSDITVENAEGKDFSFVTDDLQGTKIEDRETFGIIGSEAFKKRLQRLRAHYEGIKDEITAGCIPANVLSAADIDYIITHVITEEHIRKAIEKLNDKRKANDAGLAFIGNKVGLYEYSYEGNKMTWKCYRSDHFTWKVFKELYLMRQVPEGESQSPYDFFNNLCVRLAKYQDADLYRNVLTHTLCYLFSSMGIDLLVIGENCRSRKVCLASVRSARIERSHLSRIHVSVDESFSDTDQKSGGEYTVEAWARRGIEEEIGLPEAKQKEKTGIGERIQITYTDFSIVLGYGEIGLSGIVEDKEIDTTPAYPGMDKALESEGMFFVPVPSLWKLVCIAFSKNMNRFKRYVEKHSGHPKAKLPWVEFAPPIYIRTMLRQVKLLPVKGALLFFSFASLTIPVGYAGLCNHEWGIPSSSSWLISGASLLLWSVMQCQKKYSRFSLWQPLWDGNVKILQSTGQIIKNQHDRDVNDGLYLMAEKQKTFPQAPPLALPMDKLQLKETPLCAVRRSTPRDELPISFYQVCHESNGRGEKHLRLLSVYYGKRELYYYVVRTQDKHQERPAVRAYSFNFGLEKAGSVCLTFDKTLNTLGINENSLKCYFKLHEHNIDNCYCHKLPDEFNSRYQLYDLFEYKENYYWSACHKDAFPLQIASGFLTHLYLLHCQEEEKKDVPAELNWNVNAPHDNYIKTGERIWSYRCDMEGRTIFIDIARIYAPSDRKFEKQVNQLVGNSLERFGGKMNELEVQALQYILVRDGIFVADIGYGKLYDYVRKDWGKIAENLLRMVKTFTS